MHDLHKHVHPCPRADQYDQARAPADTRQPLMVGRGQWCTGPRAQCWHNREDTNRVIVNLCQMGWIERLWRWHWAFYLFIWWNLHFLINVDVGSFNSCFWDPKPCDVEITWSHALSIFGILFCMWIASSSQIFGLNKLQKMENIRQTFTDASTLLSKAVKVKSTFHKSKIFVMTI